MKVKSRVDQWRSALTFWEEVALIIADLDDKMKEAPKILKEDEYCQKVIVSTIAKTPQSLEQVFKCRTQTQTMLSFEAENTDDSPHLKGG